jgi:hypothetical protein
LLLDAGSFGEGRTFKTRHSKWKGGYIMRLTSQKWISLTGIVAAVAVVAALVAGVAEAGTTTAAKDKTAVLTGTSTWLPNEVYAIGGTFNGEGQLGDGTYSGTLTGGPPTFPGPGGCGPVCEDVTGTITFSAKKGDLTVSAQPGTELALEEIASHSFRDFALDLEVVSGTRGYAHASGRLTLVYHSVWTHTFIDDVFVSVIVDSGTLTGDLR